MIDKKITLVLFNEKFSFQWQYGDVFNVDYTAVSIHKILPEIHSSASDYILFWDARNTFPTDKELENVLNSKGDLWHVGSKLSFAKEMPVLDCIQPVSMIHLDVNSNLDHSSWKISLKGCLMKRSVFDQVPFSKYMSEIDLLGLDFGYKALKFGVITRYSSILAKNIVLLEKNSSILLQDELTFVRNNFDKKAFIWCYLMHLFKVNLFLFIKLLKSNPNKEIEIYNREDADLDISSKDGSVSIVIATLERYPCLIDVLLEVRELDAKPKEIIIIDQTRKEIRSTTFLNSFSDLPITYLETNTIGQCTARNLGIKNATSKFIWFLDDDMKEIPKDYLNRHLHNIYSFNADISCGIPDEIGTNYINRAIHKVEISEGFPTNDILVKRELLNKVGGFDVKMDQKQSEDQEIGLRCMKTGALSIKDNKMRILHLRASRGGLRNHNVRKITFASSRNSLFQRRFLHYSELYLNLKHFDRKKIDRFILLNIRGTFIIRGNVFKKILKIVIATLVLPDTIIKSKKNLTKALVLKNANE